MKTTCLKSIYFTKQELKDALIDYVDSYAKNAELVPLMINNVCEMDWSQDGKEFIITIVEELID